MKILYLTKITEVQIDDTINKYFVDMCGVEGKRRLCDLNVTSSSPALVTRHINL